MLMSNKMLLASSFLISPGDADAANGGYRAYNNFGDGLLYNLNVAAKSTEASKAYGGSSLSGTSRLNGPDNNTKFLANESLSTAFAIPYADQLVFDIKTDWYVGAIDELKAISAKLSPTAATNSLFQTGGSEAYSGGVAWSSTEIDTSNTTTLTMTTASETSSPKNQSRLVRPIRRFVTDMPFPIGTAMEGGYLAAYFTDLSSGAPLTYMLIVADKTTEVARAYQTSPSTLGGIYLSRTNGSAPTEANGATTNQSAFAYCFNLTSGTKTDWYLPAADELLTAIRMNSSLPVGQRFTASSSYWSSTEANTNFAKAVDTNASTVGTESSVGKTTSYIVRPVRRILLP